MGAAVTGPGFGGLKHGEFVERGFQRGLVTEVDEDGPLFRVLFESGKNSGQPFDGQDGRLKDPSYISDMLIDYPSDGYDVALAMDSANLEAFPESDTHRVVVGSFIHCHDMWWGALIPDPDDGDLALWQIGIPVYCVEPTVLPADHIDAFLNEQAAVQYQKVLQNLHVLDHDA